MPQLEELILENAREPYRLSDAALEHLRHLPKLKRFNLDGGSACGVGLRHVASPDLIESLSFDRTPISDSGLEVIGGFPNLRRLMLGEDAEVTDEGMRQLQKCHLLKRLDLALCTSQQLTDATVESLAELPALEYIAFGSATVTDACVASLLRMLKLKKVEFGNDTISVETVERLRNAGIDVSHGRLKDNRRSENVLRYLGVDFAVDTERSVLRASINPDRDDVTWELDIKCLNEFVPEHMQAANLQGPPISFTKDWRALEGEEFRISFDEAELHPIMPGNPGNIYVGWHACPNNHMIRFLKRNGAKFLIVWTCVAKESIRDEGEPVWFHGEIEFKGVTVSSDEPLPFSRARTLVMQHFDPVDLGEPVEQPVAQSTRYFFPTA